MTNLAHQAAAHAAEASGHGITHMMMHLVLQLAIIIIVAKIGGYLFQRLLKMPPVLGELASGMLIGPYALGGQVDLPGLGILFAENAGVCRLDRALWHRHARLGHPAVPCGA